MSTCCRFLYYTISAFCPMWTESTNHSPCPAVMPSPQKRKRKHLANKKLKKKKNQFSNQSTFYFRSERELVLVYFALFTCIPSVRSSSRYRLIRLFRLSLSLLVQTEQIKNTLLLIAFMEESIVLMSSLVNKSHYHYYYNHYSSSILSHYLDQTLS